MPFRVGFGTKCLSVGSRPRRGSKEASTSTGSGSACRGVHTSTRRHGWSSSVSIRTRRHTWRWRSTPTRQCCASSRCERRGSNEHDCCSGPQGLMSGRGRSSPRPAWASCWRVSSSTPANTSLTCPPRCLLGSGCWARARAARTIPTMRARRRSQRCGNRDCAPSTAIARRRNCGCWPTGITIWVDCEPSRCAGCIRCCVRLSAAHVR